MVVKIILDTNFLLLPYQFKLDIFTEIDRIILEKYEIYILDKTIEELKKLINNQGEKVKNKLAATLALQLIKVKKIPIIKTKENASVDDIIAKLEGYVIATQDIELKKRLNCKIITMRAKKKLILV
jgi:hypothetical protein